MADGERQVKREKADEDDDEEMEIDEDEETGQQSTSEFTSGTSMYLSNQHMLVLRHPIGSLRASYLSATHIPVTVHKPPSRSHGRCAIYIVSAVSNHAMPFFPFALISNPDTMDSALIKSSNHRRRMHKVSRSKWLKSCSNP